MEKAKNILAAFALVVAAGACIYTSTVQLATRRALQVSSSRIAVSPVVRGADVIVPISIENKGSSTGRVLSVTASCGCTSILAEDGEPLQFPIKILPGNRLALRAQLNTEDVSEGERTVSVALRCEDTAIYDQVVRIDWEVLRSARAVPMTVRHNLQSGKESVFWVGGRKDDDFSIDRVESSLPSLRCSIVEDDVGLPASVISRPYEDWEPRYKVAIEVVRGDEEQATGFVNVWLSGSNDPLSVRVDLFDHSDLACTPRTIWVNDEETIVKLLRVNGLDARSKLIPSENGSIRLACVAKNQDAHQFEIVIEEAFLIDMDSNGESSKLVRLDEFLDGVFTGRCVRLNISNGIQ